MADREENSRNLRSRRNFSNFTNVDDLTEEISSEVKREISEKKKRKDRSSVDSIFTNAETKSVPHSTTSILRGTSDPIFTSLLPHSPKSIKTPTLSTARKRRKLTRSPARKKQIMSGGDNQNSNVSLGTPVTHANSLVGGAEPPVVVRSDSSDEHLEDAMETDDYTSPVGHSMTAGNDFLEVIDQGREAREARQKNAETLDAIFSHIEMHMDEDEQKEYRHIWT